jgi:hypothetical protein
MEVYLNSIEMGMVYTGAQAALNIGIEKKLLILPNSSSWNCGYFAKPENILHEFSSYINNRKQKLCV